MISEIVDTAVEMAFLIGVGWTATFGGCGALLARRRGIDPVHGVVLGFLLGPIGWMAIAQRGNAGTRDTHDPESLTGGGWTMPR